MVYQKSEYKQRKDMSKWTMIWTMEECNSSPPNNKVLGNPLWSRDWSVAKNGGTNTLLLVITSSDQPWSPNKCSLVYNKTKESNSHKGENQNGLF